MPAKSAEWNDDRKDWFEIVDKNIKKDFKCVALILMKNGLINKRDGYTTLKTKYYGNFFNLCECELFRDQPVVAVRYFTGFLVKEDIIATANHCANEENVTSLRIVFEFKMLAPFTPVKEIPSENIYIGKKIIGNRYKRNGSDWALVKLDRKVKNQETATLSRGEISSNQVVHSIGHPAGLPLKYTAGANVCDNTNKIYFTANLNICTGNSGSPVFNSDTHEVIGIVVRGYNRNFKLMKNCWRSIYHPNLYRQEGAQCTRVSEFIDIVAEL
jgi:hypothetical protein